MSSALVQNPIFITVTLDEDTTGGLDVTVPRDCIIRDIFVYCTATSGGGTVDVIKRTGTTIIVDVDIVNTPIVCATSAALTRAVDLTSEANSTLLVSDTTRIRLVTNGAADRGVVTIICEPTPSEALTTA